MLEFMIIIFIVSGSVALCILIAAKVYSISENIRFSVSTIKIPKFNMKMFNKTRVSPQNEEKEENILPV